VATPIQFEQLHLTILAPRGLRHDKYDPARRTLDASRFRGDLRRGIRGVIRRYPALARFRYAITR